MIRIRRGTVLEARERRAGLVDLVVQMRSGAREAAIAYPGLCGPVAPGDSVVLNTTAAALGLGTGGAHFVMAVEGGPDVETFGRGHAIKARYTPTQVKVEPVEESHAREMEAFGGLGGVPVIAAGLHSALAPVSLGLRAVAPAARLCYVMTDAGALPLALSDTVAALREAGLLHATLTAGQAFGGDHEAVNLWSAIAAARAVCGADVVVVGMGPGNLGTGTRLGHASLEVGAVVNAAAALGGLAIVAPRISFADARERHRGVSHHTLTALALAALARADVALPRMEHERARLVRRQLAESGALRRHRAVDVNLGDAAEAALASSPVALESMGRGFAEDPDMFRAAAAAGVHAARNVAAPPGATPG